MEKSNVRPSDGEKPQTEFRQSLTALFYEVERLEEFSDEFYGDIQRFDTFSRDDEKEELSGPIGKDSSILDDLRNAINRMRKANRHNSATLTKMKTL